MLFFLETDYRDLCEALQTTEEKDKSASWICVVWWMQAQYLHAPTRLFPQLYLNTLLFQYNCVFLNCH